MLALTDTALPSAAVTTHSYCIQITSLILKPEPVQLQVHSPTASTNWSESITDIMLMLLDAHLITSSLRGFIQQDTDL